MRHSCTRRGFLASLGGAAACLGEPAHLMAAPTAPVSIAKCPDYGSGLLPTLDRMFDQIGGLGHLVRGKTVAVKLNLTGRPSYRLGFTPLEDAQWTHRRVIGATIHLLGRAGARRIRLLESPWSSADPVEEYILTANWDPRGLLHAASNVEFENTNYLGRGKNYSRLPVPGGGYLFRAFDLNHSYEECDVFVSLAKLKEHVTAGVTLSMKNCFGITPCTIYGTGAGENEPSEFPTGGRDMLHQGNRQPSKTAPPEKDLASPREGGYRIPRIVTDLVSARPIHLAIIDGIHTMAGGEGPWVRGCRPVRPGVLIAGTNPVTTDAVATAVMGFDPMADRGTAPFETCDSTLRLAEEHGVGTRDLRRIEVLGTAIRDARFDFRAGRKPGV